MARWPTIKTQAVKPREARDYEINATVDMDGRPFVAIHRDDQDDEYLFPHEAERLARALLKCATVARAKKLAAKKEPTP